jgi:hypothetical protein
LAESPSKEVEIMKKFLMALAVLAIASAPALAGFNENGVIVVANTHVPYYDGMPLPPASDSLACADMDNQVPMYMDSVSVSEFMVWKVYAAFPLASTPRLKACGWGIAYPPVSDGFVYVSAQDAPSTEVFAITSAGWPASGTEVGMSFSAGAELNTVTELWWFGGYSYTGSVPAAQLFSIVPNSVAGNCVFVDDSVPFIEDLIAGYGSLGFGQAGVTPCPTDEPVTGACCLPTSECVMLSVEECAAVSGTFFGGDCSPSVCPPPPVFGACCVNFACNIVTPDQCSNVGGQFFGEGSLCEPTPCPVPVETRSWGQIKNSYR